MFWKLLLLFTLVPVIELFVLIEIGSRIGGLATVALVLITGTVGAWLAKMQGFVVLRRLQMETNSGQLPGDALLDGVMILVGGLTLLTPGFLTDIVGLSLLLPGTRRLWLRFLVERLRHYMTTGSVFIYRR